jgi:hypothetical protein
VVLLKVTVKELHSSLSYMLPGTFILYFKFVHK